MTPTCNNDSCCLPDNHAVVCGGVTGKPMRPASDAKPKRHAVPVKLT